MYDTTATPQHTVKLKAYIDLPKKFSINITGDWANSFSGGDGYDYLNQRWPSIALGSQTDYRYNEFNNNRIRLNIKISKEFLDGKFTAYLWGNDLLEDGTVVRARQFSQSVPTQLQRMYGFGVVGKF